MRISGVKFICDRCGKEEFYELNKTLKENMREMRKRKV